MVSNVCMAYVRQKAACACEAMLNMLFGRVVYSTVGDCLRTSARVYEEVSEYPSIGTNGFLEAGIIFAGFFCLVEGASGWFLDPVDLRLAVDAASIDSALVAGEISGTSRRPALDCCSVPCMTLLLARCRLWASDMAVEENILRSHG